MKNPYLGPEVTQEVLSGITQKLDEIDQLLNFAVGLSSRDRQRRQALGRQRVQFVQLSLEHLQQNPALVPPYFNSVEVIRNFGLHQDLQKILEKMKQVSRQVSDTVHYTGAQAATDALAYYSVVKRAAKAGVPGIEAAKERMKTSVKRVNRSGDKSGIVPDGEQAVA
jgi:hypothetical protein